MIEAILDGVDLENMTRDQRVELSNRVEDAFDCAYPHVDWESDTEVMDLYVKMQMQIWSRNGE